MMQLTLTRWTEPEQVLAAYEVYKPCMYLPTEEKFRAKVGAYLRDDAVRVFGCTAAEKVVGMVAVRVAEGKSMEVLGIAAAETARGQGIGTFMLRQAAEYCGAESVFAETDDDAVGFYRKCGFAITKLEKDYDGTPVTRYLCKWEK